MSNTFYTVDDLQVPSANVPAYAYPEPVEPSRFFLSHDEDDHWYLIPVENFDEWQDWINLSTRDWAEDDDRPDWEVPEYAKLIDGPQVLSFTDPKEDL